ncbi:hypothetical protein Tco_1547002 [Tanacetum coccineum]
MIDLCDTLQVPSTERVKISSTNVRLETTVHQKEETFQVVIDVIKNSTCFKAFTITTEVPEIFIQQFWYTIKKVKDSESYEFILANKKCIVDAGVFRKILDICPRVEGEDFTEVQDDDATLTFLIDLGYKGPLHKYTNMYVDHMHQPWRTLAAIINKCLSRKTDDGIVSRLKFVRLGEDYQEYGLPIPDMMLNDVIKRSESYQMFLKYLTGQITPKKSRGKGSQGKKTADTPMADVDVSEESDSEPARKRTASQRVVKKKVIISATDNIIPDLAVALELDKSISLTEAAKEEAARQVHATHARIVTESEPEPAKKKTSSRSTRGVVIEDTPNAPNPNHPLQSLNIRRQPDTRGSNEGTGVSPGVLDESTVIPATSSERTGTIKQESEYSEEDQGDDEEVDWIDFDEDEEKKDDTDDDKSINLEMTDDVETDDEFIHGVEQVNDDEDEEMTNAEVEESRNGDDENTDAAKTDAGKTKEVKDDANKAELPLTSSSLSVSSSFGDQFLKLSFDTSLVSTVKDTTDAEINSLLDIKIQSEVPHIQSPFVLGVPVSVIFEPSVLILVQETPSVARVTTLPPLSVFIIPPLRVTKLENDVFELKKIDLFAEALATLKSQVLTVVDDYLGSKLGDALQKTLQNHSVQPAPESSKIQKPAIDLE